MVRWRFLALVIGLAVGSVLLEWALDPVLGESNYLVVSLAVGVAALYGGMTAGLLVTALGAVGMVVTQFEPLMAIGVPLVSEILQTATFVAIGIVFSYLAGVHHRTLAGQIAARKEADASARRTEIVNEVTRSLLQTPLNLGIRAETIAESLAKQLADCCMLMLWNGDQLCFSGQACRDGQGGAALIRLVEQAAATGGVEPFNPTRVSRTGVAEHGSLSPTEPLSGRLSELRSAGVATFALVPLPKDVGMSGVIVLLRKSGSPGFDDDDMALLQTVALTVGTTLGNAQLYVEAQRAIEARDRLNAAVSHDLKNPLNVVLLSVDLLQRSAVDPALTYVRELAVTIKRSAERMSLLVRDMLDLASLEHGKLALSFQDLDPLTISTEAVALLQPLAVQKSQTLGLIPPERPVPPVRADRDRLLQVFSNLLGNAIAYTPEGGTITVALTAGKGDVTVAIADTGPGIPPDQMSRLFERYWRGEGSGAPGTGLGLSIAKGIVDAHGGRIWAESRPGGGATFRFTLPLAVSARRPKVA
jgi:signal transduction histidine kinase